MRLLPFSGLGRGLALASLVFASACTITHKTTGEPVEKPIDGGDDAAADAAGDGDGDGDEDAASDADVIEDAARDAAPDAAPDADMQSEEDAGDDEVMVSIPCEQQLEEALDGLPDDVACIGLYADVATKLVASNVRRYAPALVLWSDGAGKQRWIHLPEGGKIDATDPNNWEFPVGTKFFKEFRVEGRRVETRIFQKIREDRWSRATYAWNRDESAAIRSFGEDVGDVKIAGQPYHIPTGGECEQCHGGRRDRVLGFEAIALGLPGAEGVTLKTLVDEDLIEPAPIRTQLSFGDDGTDLAAEMLGYTHMNCGVCCHNSNENADAFASGLFMKLDVNELDGRPVNNFEPIQLLVDQTAKTLRWGDRKRVVPGDPEASLLYQLITSRAGPKEQMPPIATQVVDSKHADVVRRWIEALPHDD
jgi:hypothetical protein